MADPNNDSKTVGVLWSGSVPRSNADGTTTVYCRNCGRPITRMARPTIRTVSRCALCLARAQGVKDPEKHVLPQYVMTDPTRAPIAMEEGNELEALYPELVEQEKGKRIPMVGGMFGTAKAMFRAVVGWLGQEEEPQPKQAPLSKKITREKRTGGLFER